MSGKISQKEYLKKYLSGDLSQTKKKKKKKEKSALTTSVKIVDDDIDLSQLAHANDEDFEKFNLGEDAPQIVGVVDDRPPDLVAKEDYNKSTKWKTLGTNDATSNSIDLTLSKSVHSVDSEQNSFTSPSKRCDRSSDASPPRRTKRSPDNLPRRRMKSSPEYSPPRRPKPEASSPRRKKRSSNVSPSWRTKRSPDGSPPRRIKRSSDTSPSRKTRRSSNNSPLRRAKRSPDDSPPRRMQRSSDNSPPRRSKQSPDASPLRRAKRSPDASPPRRMQRDSDNSPPRRSRRSPDVSPQRGLNQNFESSLRRRLNQSFETSQSRRLERNPHASQSLNTNKNPNLTNKSFPGRSSDSPPPTHKKMMKTLDGKVAGLQDANALREENERFRKHEDKMFKNIARDQPADTEAVVRNRKTGRRRNLHEESAKEMEKIKKQEERKAVYDRWSKGLKQIEEFKERVTEEAHEMSKPLARYSNDEDLDKYLRSQCRDGDPMAEYFRKKANDTQSGPSMPIYQGSFPENRFNIRPGYRWDGVDRSNGYETKWFQVQSKKKATEEESYKYSVEDM